MSKIRVVLFYILMFVFCISQVYAQENQRLYAFLDSTRKVSLDLKDASLKDILKAFSIQAEVNFIASQEIEDRTVTLYLDKVSIKEAMDKLFRANKLDYEYDEKAKIILVKKAEPEIKTITKVYYLKHRSVPSATIEKEKASLLANDKEGKTSGEVDIITSIKQVLSENGKISEDIRTNSLIITDIPSCFPFIEEIINCLDIPQPQIMLEVEILDVGKDMIDKFGFKFENSPFTLILPGEFAHRGARFFMGDLDKRGKKLDDTDVEGSMILGTTYGALLEFLRTQQDTRYLARPRILTLNNETAEISVTKDEVVTRRLKWIQEEGGEGHWEAEYERATSLSLTPEGIGVYLRVTPRINPETKEITMVINPKTSSATQSPFVSAEVELARDPEVRSTKSIVKVLDGETIVLGGLIHREKSETLEKIPILGDIPLLGGLFRHRNKEKDLERELLVFITPRIVEGVPSLATQGSMAILSSREQDNSSKGARLSSIEGALDSLSK